MNTLTIACLAGLAIACAASAETKAMTKAVFAGNDARGHRNLWVTDGTAAGTSELAVAGAHASGLFYSTSPFSPDFTVLGAKTLFDGFDATGHYNLWVTDGTSAGTKELPIAGACSCGLFGSTLVVPNFTVLGSKALFSGYDTHVHINLWVTDGTAAGTSELTVAGASSNGLFYGGVSPHFIVVGSRALFVGIDASNRLGLWVTDGTSAGTSELAVAGAYSQGLFSDSDPDFTVLGTKALERTRAAI